MATICPRLMATSTTSNCGVGRSWIPVYIPSFQGPEDETGAVAADEAPASSQEAEHEYVCAHDDDDEALDDVGEVGCQLGLEDSLAGEESPRGVADVGAGEVERYAARERLGIFFSKAGVGAGSAALSAVEAGLYALNQR